MASNRIYPLKRCENPGCNEEFNPHDKRQLYCTRQCRINCNNDKKNIADEKPSYQQKLERSDLILEYLYTHAGGAQFSIKESMLLLNKVDLTLGTLVKNIDNGDTMQWYINYGLKLIDDVDKYYFILSLDDIEFY